MVRGKWESYAVRGNSISRFRDKMKLLKADLKVWNRDVFGCFNTNKKRILKEIEDLDNQDDANDLVDNVREKRMDLLNQLRISIKHQNFQTSINKYN